MCLEQRANVLIAIFLWFDLVLILFFFSYWGTRAGQGLKDVILRGRPASPPVIRVQRKGALECGMPSTHAMVSLTVPVSVFVLTAERYEYRFALGNSLMEQGPAPC